MDKAKFTDLLVGRRFRADARRALELVFVQGMSQADAARVTGLHRQAVNRAVKKFLSNLPQ